MPTHSGTAEASKPAFFICNTNRIGKRIGALSGANRFFERNFAVVVLAVGQHNERFASALLAHQIVGSQIDGIEQCSAACAIVITAASAVATVSTSATAPDTAISATAGARLLISTLGPVRLVKFIERLLQSFARPGQILQ